MPLDVAGNVTFAVGLVAILTGITYGIQPAGGHDNGWASPFVDGCFVVGVVVLALFGVIERRSRAPLCMTSFGIPLFNLAAWRWSLEVQGNVPVNTVDTDWCARGRRWAGCVVWSPNRAPTFPVVPGLGPSSIAHRSPLPNQACPAPSAAWVPVGALCD